MAQARRERHGRHVAQIVSRNRFLTWRHEVRASGKGLGVVHRLEAHQAVAVFNVQGRALGQSAANAVFLLLKVSK